MRVNHTASALATLALLSGAAVSSAQQAAPVDPIVITLSDTSTDRIDGGSGYTDSATADTSRVDPREESADSDSDGWSASPAFLELRLLTSRHSTVPTRMASTAYRDLYIVDLRAGWTLTSNRFLSVEYAPSLVPLAISTRNPTEYEPRVANSCIEGKDCNNYKALSISTVPLFSTTYGFGLTPVGFQMRLFRTSPVQLLTYANGGALWFTHRIPDPEATRFNFTAELGAALQVNLPDRLGLVLGYSWHHTSNAGTGHVNPGLNSRALSIGIVARKGR
ncbi:MAG TPA: acyloxyacyl hydrolase [Gemmatimonadaceae bacterium]|nr:acyloxyacyl hydrolase [Gemmatimonadaceae bacterium]